MTEQALSTTSNSGILERDIEHCRLEIAKLPVQHRNPTLCEKVVRDILPVWGRAFSHATFTRILKKLPKELNETEPAITYIQNQVNNVTITQQEQQFTIVDVCSGFGIASMLLSELLDPSRVDTIWLLDKAWPFMTTSTTSDTPASSLPGRHISTFHIFHYSWPIPLKIRKMDLKRTREQRQLPQYVYGNSSNTIFMGIHLCKKLSVHAINLFFTCGDNAHSLVLKPCCLPGEKHLYVRDQEHKRIPLEYKFANGYSFLPSEMYTNDQQEAKGESDEFAVDTDVNDQEEEDHGDHNDCPKSTRHSQTSNARFSLWLNHLECGAKSDEVTVERMTFDIQPHHFQNDYLVCQRIQTTRARKGNE